MQVKSLKSWASIVSFTLVVAMSATPAAAQPEDLEAYLDILLPGMGAEKIAESESAQRQWEQICRGLCVPGREAERVEASRLMASRLGSETPAAARICLLRQLEYLGGEECVAAASAALGDKDRLVARAARRALTMNPSSAANASLLARLPAAADDDEKIGLLIGLGQRADPASTAAVAKLLDDSNEQVVAAAARSLGMIASLDAAAALQAQRAKSTGDLRLALSNATLRCANNMLAHGKTHRARELFEDLSRQEEADSVRLSGLHGQIKAAGDWGTVKLIAKFLRGDDAAAAGVGAGHMAGLDSVHAKKLVEIFGQLPPASQVLLLDALKLRADKAVLPEVVAATKSSHPQVRLAALRALATVGDATVVPLLLEALNSGGSEASAARHALEAVYGEGTDEKIIAAMQAADQVGPRARLIEVLHRRRSTAAVSALVAEALHKDAEVRRRAMSALSELAEIEDVPSMVQGVLQAEAGGERDQAEKAVMLLCNRLEDPEQRAAPVLVVYETASEADQQAMLPLLGRIGGAKALEKINAALKSDDKQRYDVATRAIANWPNGDVAPRLLELFQSSEEERHQLRAMRAFIRVIALRNERPNSESLELLKKAMELCSRDEERNLILSRTISAEIRSIEALRFVLPYVNDPATAQQACRAIVGLSHHRYLRRPNQDEFNKALSEVIRVSEDVGLVDQARRYRSDL